MKSLLPIIIVALLSVLTSCVSADDKQESEEITYNRAQDYYQEIMDDSHVVKDKDGCEYIMSNSWREGYMSHKGTCSNPVHKQ